MGSSSKPDGIAVLRTEDVSGRAGRVLRVVEFIAAPTHSLQLATAVFAYGRKHGCAYADIFFHECLSCGFSRPAASYRRSRARLPYFATVGRGPDLPALLSSDAVIVLRTMDLDPRRFSRIHVFKGYGNMDWLPWSDD